MGAGDTSKVHPAQLADVMGVSLIFPLPTMLSPLLNVISLSLPPIFISSLHGALKTDVHYLFIE